MSKQAAETGLLLPSREVLLWAAHSYFDALEGDSGKIGAFADDCVRHENGYQTVANKHPGGRRLRPTSRRRIP